MDRVNQYHQIVQDFLKDFAADDPEAQLIFDAARDRYLVMHNGWRGEYRIYSCAMQLVFRQENFDGSKTLKI